MKTPLMSSSVIMTWLSSANLKKDQEKFPKLKCKKKKLWDKKIQALWRNFKRCNMYIIRTPEGEKRENRAQEIFEEIMSENFLKLQYTKMQINKQA